MELTREQIKEGNEAIAKFLGWFKQESQSPDTWWERNGYANYIAYSIPNNYPYQDLPFHRDWNYLMRVIDKIGTVVYHREGDALDYDWKKHYSYNELFTDIFNVWLRHRFDTHSDKFNLMNSLESVWSAVVAYIYYYENSTKEKLVENCKYFDEAQGRNLCTCKVVETKYCFGVCECFTEK